MVDRVFFSPSLVGGVGGRARILSSQALSGFRVRNGLEARSTDPVHYLMNTCPIVNPLRVELGLSCSVMDFVCHLLYVPLASFRTGSEHFPAFVQCGPREG